MFNCNPRPTGLAAVLIFGLISCAPEKRKERDVFIAPPPKLLISGQTQDLKAFDQSTQKILNLGDAIDMRDSHAAAVVLVSRCRKSDRDSIKTVRTGIQAPVQLFQVLPHEIVASDLKAQTASCTFEIQLANSVGSRHIFTVGPVVVSETVPVAAELSLERGGAALPPNLRLRFGDLESVRLRGQITGTARLVCEDWESRDVRFDQSALLGAFDVHNMQARPATTGQPVEICRVAVLTNSLITHLSEPIQIYFSRAFKVTPVELPRRGYAWDPAAVLAVRAEIEMPAGTFRVDNEEGYSRTVKISKKALVTNSMMILNGDSGSCWPTNSFAFTHIQVTTGQGSTVREGPEDFEIVVGAHGYFQVISKYRNQARVPAFIKVPIAGIYVGFPEPVLIHELNPKGEEIDQHPLSLGPPMIFTGDGPKTLFENLNFNSNPNCVWNG